jgi:hypothetical protein
VCSGTQPSTIPSWLFALIFGRLGCLAGESSNKAPLSILLESERVATSRGQGGRGRSESCTQDFWARNQLGVPSLLSRSFCKKAYQILPDPSRGPEPFRIWCALWGCYFCLLGVAAVVALPSGLGGLVWSSPSSPVSSSSLLSSSSHRSSCLLPDRSRSCARALTLAVLKTIFVLLLPPPLPPCPRGSGGSIWAARVPRTSGVWGRFRSGSGG